MRYNGYANGEQHLHTLRICNSKGNGRFYRPFSFFAFFKKLFKKVLTNRKYSVIIITEIKGSGLPLEAIMKKFWFGMVGNWDYMATFGCFAEAETEEAAVEIIKAEYPNSTIQRVVEMAN